ncbi:hypothetical protein DOTSEDRAFT_47906 [Dothistroma septosporum NZE10]|uniref:Uncharacterized protein n=1 Tax=Dothistroma septosporum (strain NZE10 / CBS 128990) TaxID=675120 RepID=M2WK87_DOTSN|nr:hypothetical protein DOTSEDRAFT_47906 [Dothistroma septosporum NZE10]
MYNTISRTVSSPSLTQPIPKLVSVQTISTKQSILFPQSSSPASTGRISMSNSSLPWTSSFGNKSIT